MLFKLALVGLLFLLSNSSRAQKNTLYLWVDTVYVDTAQTDVILDVKFELDVQRPPVKFYGYNAEIDYGPSSYVKVTGGKSGVITQNTASRFIPDPLVTISDNSVKVVALGSSSAPIDLTYSTLFRIRMTAFAPDGGGGGLPQGERAFFIWDYLQLVDDSGIDTIVYGGGFVERKKSVPVPIPDTVKVVIPSISVKRDSTFDIPVLFDATSGSNITHFAYSFDYDSAVVRLDSAFLAPTVVGATLSKDIQPTHADIFIQSLDTTRIEGGYTLFYLRFTAKPRTDTVCTSLQQVGFTPINSDALVDQRILEVGNFCVSGFTSGPIEAVKENEMFADLRISPNPASELVTIELPEQAGRYGLSIYDAAGHLVHQGAGRGKSEWAPGLNPRGAYWVVVTLNGASISRQLIVN